MKKKNLKGILKQAFFYYIYFVLFTKFFVYQNYLKKTLYYLKLSLIIQKLEKHDKIIKSE